MNKTERYEHHGCMVTVMSAVKGKHREHCLCHICSRFMPGTPENCPIAQANYELCLKYNVVTPVYECPMCVEMEDG